MQTIDNADTGGGDDEEAALIDAFFLPGGILDPEGGEGEKGENEQQQQQPPPPPPPVAAEAAASLLFAAQDMTWLSSSEEKPPSQPSQHASTAGVENKTNGGASSSSAAVINDPWFGQGLLLSTATAADGQPLSSEQMAESIGLNQQTSSRTETSSVAEIDASAFSAAAGLLQQNQHQRSSSQPSIPSWTLPLPQNSLEEVLLDQGETTTTSTTTSDASAAKQHLAHSKRHSVASHSPVPGPPPGFETTVSAELSAESPSFTPSSMSVGTVTATPPPKKHARGKRASKKTTTAVTTPSTEERKSKQAPVASSSEGVGQETSTASPTGDYQNKTSAKKNDQPVSSPYRQAVVGSGTSATATSRNRGGGVDDSYKTPRRGKTKNQNPKQSSTSSSQHEHHRSIEEELQGEKHTTGNESSSNLDPSVDPSSSSYSMDEDFQLVQASSHLSDDQNWNEIVRSPSQRPKSSPENVRSMGSSNKSGGEANTDESRREAGNQQQKRSGVQVGEPKSTSREGISTDRVNVQARSKPSSRRQQQQQQQHGGKNEGTGSAENDKQDEETNAVTSLFTSISENAFHVMAWSNEILFPALKHSLLAMALSALHSLRGIFLIFLAAFHAYSFAADETLAQLNLESAWIPYVSLIYAPTATRHAMNFLDLPHFTPHLVSSAVLCFLFRRPAGLATKRAPGGKPTTADLHYFILRCCQLFIPFDLCMDGFSSVNTSIMTLSYTDRLLLAYVICTIRKGWLLVPVGWVSFAAQCLVAAYFPWKHILAEPILLFILFSMGMASLNVLRILDHWKQRAKKAKIGP